MCGRWRGAWASAGWRVWDLGNGAIVKSRMANYFQIFPPLVFSYRLFFFTNRGNFQVRTWVWRKFAAENRVNFKEGIGQESNGAFWHFSIIISWIINLIIYFQVSRITNDFSVFLFDFVKWSSQSKQTNFHILPDLAFGFVHKRSGNEFKQQQEKMRGQHFLLAAVSAFWLVKKHVN